MDFTIKPFRATYYNPSLIKSLSKVVCPPYDVINRKQEMCLRKKSPYNFCNILLTSHGNNYKDIKNRFKNWLAQGILIDDDQEHLYLYEQQFLWGKKKYCRFGFLSLLRMDQKGAIFPHEHTLQAPKIDRKQIIKEVEANLSPIFVIVPKQLHLFQKIYAQYVSKKPLFQFKDFHGHRNRIWKIENEEEIKRICREVDKNKLVIADGHHRFEVAYDYFKENKKRFKNLNYILAHVTDFQKGLLILPTHRVVELDVPENVFWDELKKYFSVTCVKKDVLEKKLKNKGTFCFGIYRDSAFYFLTLKNPRILKELLDKPIYKELDTYLLHHIVLSLFQRKGDIHYTHTIEEAQRAAIGKNKAAFLLRAVPLETVFKIANKSHRLPQKSTYFYPKIVSGIVMRRFGV